MDARKGMICLSVVLVLVVTACGTAATPTPLSTAALEAPTMPPQLEQTGRKVQLETTRSLEFNPSEIRVEPGEKIEFVITDTSGFAHTFTVADSSGKQKILQDVTIGGNETKSVTITFPEEAGKLYLFCRPHEQAGMVGTIRVEFLQASA